MDNAASGSEDRGNLFYCGCTKCQESGTLWRPRRTWYHHKEQREHEIARGIIATPVGAQTVAPASTRRVTVPRQRPSNPGTSTSRNRINSIIEDLNRPRSSSVERSRGSRRDFGEERQQVRYIPLLLTLLSLQTRSYIAERAVESERRFEYI
jgi:hypothetical protein